MYKSKVMVLMLAMVSLLAVAVPAAVQADEAEKFWYVNGKKAGGPGEKVERNTAGFVVYGAGGLVVGPCEFTDKEKIWNSATMGEGERIAHAIAVPCATNLPGCTLVKAEPVGLPWTLTVLATGKVELQGVNITSTFSPGCAVFKVPTTMTIEGTAEGTFNNESGCVEAEGESGLTLTAGESSLSITVFEEDCYEEEGGPLTVEE